MPQDTTKRPLWSAYANTLINRLRKRHGAPVAQDVDEPSELDILFQKFEGPESAERFADPIEAPSRYVPARKLLAAIRLAATIGSPDVERDACHCGALTVISGIREEDLDTLRETIKDVFPARCQVIGPDMTEGSLARNAQGRFSRIVAENLDRIEPMLILQTEGIVLPAALDIIVPIPLRMSPVTHHVLLKFLEAGHLSNQMIDAKSPGAALPSEAAIRNLGTVEICAALRAPDLAQAVERLGRLACRDQHGSAPRLEDMRADSAAITAARRIVADLQDWQVGKTKWHEISHSLLLYGTPGTGKSWLARAMANSAGVSLATGSFGTWQAAGHLGDMLREMTATFAEARRKAPCILVIDEIDAVGSRADPDRHASNYRTQVITSFLTELDKIGHEEGVVVVGTCNYIDRIDPAVLRSGRMDVKIEVPLPDADAIFEILRCHLSEDMAAHELRSLSRRAVGKSAADIDAAIRAARSDARHARMRLVLPLLESRLGIDPASETRDQIWRTAVHEAGHAIVAHALRIGEVENILIAGDGGKVSCRLHPNEGKLADITARIAWFMAGRAAERLILGEISAGAGGSATSDLAQATRAAIDIEATYGLGLQGPVWHANPDAAHLSTPAIRDRARQHITRAEDNATRILKLNLHVVDTLARHLVERRFLKTRTIARLLKGVTTDVGEASCHGPPGGP